jgi:hypothetical protein
LKRGDETLYILKGARIPEDKRSQHCFVYTWKQTNKESVNNQRARVTCTKRANQTKATIFVLTKKHSTVIVIFEVKRKSRVLTQRSLKTA